MTDDSRFNLLHFLLSVVSLDLAEEEEEEVEEYLARKVCYFR